MIYNQIVTWTAFAILAMFKLPFIIYFLGWPFPDICDSLVPFIYFLAGFALFLIFFWKALPFSDYFGRPCHFLIFFGQALSLSDIFWQALSLFNIFWWACPFMTIFDRPCPFLIFLGMSCPFSISFWQVSPCSDKGAGIFHSAGQSKGKVTCFLHFFSPNHIWH